MKTTGQILKSRREEMNISLQEVSLATKISAKILKSIEEGDTENLPPKTFVRGFVKAYAAYLKLDTENILQSFSEEMGSTKPARTVAAADNPTAATNSQTPTPQESVEIEQRQALKRNAIIIGSLLVAIVVVIAIKKKVDLYQSEAVIKTTLPPAAETANPTTEALPTSDAAPEASVDAAAAASGASSATSTDTPATTPSSTEPSTSASTPAAGTGTTPPAGTVTQPTPTTTPPPANTPPPVANPPSAPVAVKPPTPAVTTPTNHQTQPANPPATPSTSAATVPATGPTPPTSPSTLPPAPAKTQEAIIEALDQVDITMSIDGEAEKTLHLIADQVHAIKLKKKVILKISNGGAVNISVNGQDRGIAGNLGKPTRIEIP